MNYGKKFKSNLRPVFVLAGFDEVRYKKSAPALTRFEINCRG